MAPHPNFQQVFHKNLNLEIEHMKYLIATGSKVSSRRTPGLAVVLRPTGLTHNYQNFFS